MNFGIDGATAFIFDGTTPQFYPNADNTNALGAPTKRWTRFFFSEYVEMNEMTAPAAAAANSARLFLQDNGAGKTQLMVIFATGAAQQIAIEP